MAKPKRYVNQYTLDGDFVAQYNNVKDAARETVGYNYWGAIDNCCRCTTTKAGGFHWRYTDEEGPPQKLKVNVPLIIKEKKSEPAATINDEIEDFYKKHYNEAREHLNELYKREDLWYNSRDKEKRHKARRKQGLSSDSDDSE